MRMALALVLAAVLFGVPATQADESGKPMYGRWGFDAAGGDPSVKPGDDFFRYANGHWLDTTQIPSDKAAYSLRLQMSDRIEERLHQMMEGAAAHTEHRPETLEGKVGAFYKSFMDEKRIESLGGDPIETELDDVRDATTREALAGLMGRWTTNFEGTLFGTYIDVDLKDPSKYAVYLGQAGVGLPDRDYYLSAEFAGTKAKYQDHIAAVLNLIDWPEADARAADIVAYEARLAEVSWTKVQERDLNAVYNPMTIAALKKLAPGFAWDAWLKSAGLSGVRRVIVNEKSAFPKLAKIFSETSIVTLQAWQAYNIADNASPYLSRAFADEYFEMHDKTLSGQPSQQARWKRGVHAVSGGDALAGERSNSFGNLQWAVGQLYTAKYFPASSKAKIEELVDNLKAAYRARIQALDWMGRATKKEALKKLDTYVIKVGYPDKPRDYSNVVVTDDDLIGNVQRAAAADWAFYVGRLNGPVDRQDWIMTPQTNDAYNGSLRDIVFPAGILQPPIFDPNADPAINYGAAGAIIGHELTHGFDDQGRKIDAAGALRDWWTAKDAKTFEARAKVLGAQYSQYEPLPGVHINGQLTMGENIADLGGVTLALAAYRASLHGKPAPVIDGLTGDQRVFLGWAQAWRGKLRDDALRRQAVSDPHSARNFRVIGPVRNIDAWYDAFDVKPGDKYYLSPADRVRIW
ncbi:MAG: peptidase M13 [Alphaproteobacteria bacterium]|nr:peptidase M13 [Alphaproteobacteria bacterium]